MPCLLLLLSQFSALLLLTFAAGTTPWRPFHAMLHTMVGGSSTAKANETAVDEQLYSRQLLVYGKSAQHRMQDAHILVVGESPLTAEIVKNLALAGVGKISIDGKDGSNGNVNISVDSFHEKNEKKDQSMDIDEEREGKVSNAVSKGRKNQQVIMKPESRLLGDITDLVSYARGLNPYVKASSVNINEAPQDIHDDNQYTVIIMADSPFNTNIDLKKAYPGISTKTKIISCGVQGVCGYIINDFGEHFVEDANGEEVKVMQIACNY